MFEYIAYLWRRKAHRRYTVLVQGAPLRTVMVAPRDSRKVQWDFVGECWWMPRDVADQAAVYASRNGQRTTIKRVY